MTSNRLQDKDAATAAAIERVAATTSATFIANHASGSEQWHELRATGIGGSEIGAIMGLSKWESAFSLWAKKTGKIEDSRGTTESMEWGTRLEPVILDKFQEAHPDIVLHRNVGTWHHKDRSWQLANPDAVFEQWVGEDPAKGEDQAVTEWGIVEVKTAQFEDDWAEGVPPSYEAQVQWYLHTFGYRRAYVIALFHGNRYREYEVVANEFAQDTALQYAERFHEYVLAEVQPDFDGATATLQTVRELHPDIDADAEVELGDLGVHYMNTISDLAVAEERANEMKARVLDAMGNAKRGLIHDEWWVTRQARGTGTPYLVNRKTAGK